MGRVTPEELARALQDELDEALAEIAGATPVRIVDVSAPPDLGPDRVFLISLSSGSGSLLDVALPAPLAAGYLADEESAVDEWKRWLAALAARLGGA
jgi:hypothetical protein